ncbi:MAG: phosphoglycerate mutase [Frankiales bacterium]|nr:phosphoglycerate mutase [Frankiales bacterium]
MQQSLWPERLILIRHGESAGNVARDKAEAEELERIDIAERDVDVPLSEAGEEQAAALGRWIAELPEDERPTVLWVSPYVRAQQTAEIALKNADLILPAVIDERLREREFGVLDLLTRRGILAQFPEEAERRRRLGKFYHRPPGGESWSDVLLRVRAALDDVRRDCPGERVLLVAHQVVVLLARYVVERMTEEEILAIDALGDVANCSVTSYRLGDGRMELVSFNDVEHLEEQDAEVTAEPDVQAAPR